MRYTQFGYHSHDEPDDHTSGSDTDQTETKSEQADESSREVGISAIELSKETGGDHDNQSTSASASYAAQLTGVFILDFGVVLHSIFVGFTLALAGQEFTTLYPVLTFVRTDFLVVIFETC